MSAFTCPTCGSGTNKLIGKEEFDKLKCPQCFEDSGWRPTYLHQQMEGANHRSLTVAKSNIISNRVISPEDKRTVIDRRTGRETQF
jgi:predicted RNA-binding Zn-ribbon protein involved in translation (DUF1610 family)